MCWTSSSSSSSSSFPLSSPPSSFFFFFFFRYSESGCPSKVHFLQKKIKEEKRIATQRYRCGHCSTWIEKGIGRELHLMDCWIKEPHHQRTSRRQIYRNRGTGKLITSMPRAKKFHELQVRNLKTSLFLVTIKYLYR